MTTSAGPPTTATAIVQKRESERRSRARRVAKIESMRRTMDALERAQVVVRTIDDDDAVWEDFLDDEAIRMRRSLRQSKLLTNEMYRLSSEHAQLQRLVREHRLACATIEGMVVRNTSTKDWNWYVDHWREITRRNYTPWTWQECEDEMAAALKDSTTFEWSTDKQTSDLAFLGWSEVRRVDPLRGTFQYEFQKTFYDYDIMDHVNAGWDTYTHEPVHKAVVAGPQSHAFLEVLQQPGPNMMIIRRAMRYSFFEVDSHFVYLVFRTKTERGFTQCIRSIRRPELMKATDEHQDRWPSYCMWVDWDRLEDTQEKGYSLRIRGFFDVIDFDYTHEWMFRVLGTVLRSEQLVTGGSLIATV